MGINELPWYIIHPDVQYICHDTVKTEHYLHNQSFTPYSLYISIPIPCISMVISYHIHHPPLRHRWSPLRNAAVSPSAPLSLHRAVESEGGPKREDVAG